MVIRRNARFQSSSLILGSIFLCLGNAHAAGVPTNLPQGDAPRDGMISAVWSSANKQFLGTAYEAYDSSGGYSASSPTAPISKVWFSGASGVMTEIFWPSVDTPQVIDSQFLVSDGKNFFEEKHNSQTTVEWLAQGVPAFHVTNTDPQGRFVIEKTVFSDPDRDVVIQHVRITRNVPGLNFYYLHKPAVGNTPMGNSAKVSMGSRGREGDLPAGMYAWQDQQAQAVLFSIPLNQVSAGFSGGTDGYQDIRNHLAMTLHYETATQGNVAETAWLALPQDVGASEFDIAIGFGTTPAFAGGTAQASLQSNVAAMQAKYMSQWAGYQKSLFDLSGVSLDGGNLFRSSVAVLKTSEDKTRAGAFVASPTIPWGEYNHDTNAGGPNQIRSRETGGYHMVWPRDLYQMATAFLAVKDSQSAIAALNFLKSVQYTATSGDWVYGSRTHAKNGSFSQNTWTDGQSFWGGLQMDEVSMPIALAYRLWKAGQIQPEDYWDMVQRAADFVSDYGPWSPMERWEESYGASPSTIAAEISGLRCAAEYAQQMQDWDRAQKYRSIADSWSKKPGDNIETWTYTTTGGFGNGKYYTRLQGAASINEIWNPNSETMFSLGNGAGTYREKDVLDGGFLELVRFGIRAAMDPAILDTIPVYEAVVGVNLPGIGMGFHRYNHDRYNFDDATGGQTDGMIWPIFTGERGHYALQKAVESGRSIPDIDAAVEPYIQTMEKMATPQDFLPEQVWEDGPLVGKATGSATPLGWSHAEYLRLLRSRNDRAVFDRESLPQ
jgi:glucoamylase